MEGAQPTHPNPAPQPQEPCGRVGIAGARALARGRGRGVTVGWASGRARCEAKNVRYAQQKVEPLPRKWVCRQASGGRARPWLATDLSERGLLERMKRKTPKLSPKIYIGISNFVVPTLRR